VLCLLLDVLTVPIRARIGKRQAMLSAHVPTVLPHLAHVSHEESRVARRGLDEVGDIRLERMTSTMSTWRSNQLS
jgi:hypothetical protein